MIGSTFIMEELGFGFLDEYFDCEKEDQPKTTKSREDEFNILEMSTECYRLQSDGTALQRAIRKGRDREIHEIIGIYQADFDRIRNYLVRKYCWCPDDKIWLRKYNLIAIDQDICKKCKELENSSVKCSNLESAIFVVLKGSIDGEEVAVLHPTENNRMDLFRLIRTLLPNGNSSNMNAFHVLLERNKIELADFVLQKMMSYRMKHLNETETKAFNSVFHYEGHESLSTVDLVRRGVGRQKIEEYIVNYHLDLSYQWKHVTILESVLNSELALDYCWGAIRQNPKLLGLLVCEGTTIVHVCLQKGYLNILKEMYRSNPETKKYFEMEGSFGCLEGILYNKCHGAAAFMFDNHMNYFLDNFDKMKNVIMNVCSLHECIRILLMKYFPHLMVDLSENQNNDPVIYPGYDLKEAFGKHDLIFEESTIICKNPTQSLSFIRGVGGLSLFHYAVFKDNLKLCRFLIDTGCDMDAIDDEENHPIHYVRSIEMLDFIISTHPDAQFLVHRTNSHDQTILHRIFTFSLEYEPLNTLMIKIVSYGADVNLQDKNGESIAFLIGIDTQLDILLQNNLNIELVNAAGESVLEKHLKYRNVWVARELLQLLHKRPSFKENAHKYLEPFMLSNRDFFSCDYQPFLEANPESTKLIFDSVYCHSREEASRLFCKACGNAHIFITEKFLEFDYDLDYNYTPIMGLLAYIEEPNRHLVRKVLEKGVDLEVCNNWGQNALLLLAERFGSAGWYGHDTSTVKLLVEHGASIDSTDEEGNTALHYAFQNYNLDLVEVLIENGASLMTKNKDGKTPLSMVPKCVYDLLKFIEQR